MTPAADLHRETDPPGGTSRPRAYAGTRGPDSEDGHVCLPPRGLVCVRCGSPFLAGAAVHLARQYCGIGCRRDAEYEVRRVRRRLERRSAELARRLALDAANHGLLSALRSVDGTSWLADTDAIRNEVAALRRRLHALRHPQPLPREVRRGRAALNHHGTEE